MQDSFGLIAMVAMVPIISVQVVGLMYKKKLHNVVQSNNATSVKLVEPINDIIVFKRKA